jgi:hypothetical protein
MLGLLPRGTFTVLIVAVLVFAGFQYIPVYFDAWQFYDSVRQEVKFAGTSRRTIDSVRESILRHASEHEVPLRERELHVTSQGPFFVVDIYYSVPIDLRLFQHDVAFDWRLTGETFQ